MTFCLLTSDKSPRSFGSSSIIIDSCCQTFLKYYGRYRQHGFDKEQLLPGKKGARYKSRRRVVNIGGLGKGCNKYEIHSILKAKLRGI